MKRIEIVIQIFKRANVTFIYFSIRSLYCYKETMSNLEFVWLIAVNI